MTYLEEYQALLIQQGIRHFSAQEAFVKGRAHENPTHKAFQLNTDPPRVLWLHSIGILRACDMVRDAIKAPLIISSFYRSPAYNAAIGGAEKSLHMGFFATDVSSPGATPHQIFKAFLQLRDAGHFIGGIGIYDTFVHADNRGYLADWDKRTIPTTKSQLK